MDKKDKAALLEYLTNIEMYAKNCKQLIEDYEGSYTLYSLELNCDHFDEASKAIRVTVNKIQAELGE